MNTLYACGQAMKVQLSHWEIPGVVSNERQIVMNRNRRNGRIGNIGGLAFFTVVGNEYVRAFSIHGIR
jgi:hypothetical protein